MRLFTTVAGLRSSLASQKPNQKTIGFVPTLGTLHPGHLSLIKRATSENDLVVVSVFINPLQFGPGEDYNQYPRQLDSDAKLCAELGVDFLLAPSPDEMGINPQVGNQETTMVIPPVNMTKVLCGPFRPGHFAGVTTIVTKLLQIVQPHKAYFGQKDAQQLAIIRRLVKDLKIPTVIKACPIVREVSGLAYSSRNKYLSEEEKQEASVLYRSLQKAELVFNQGENNAEKLIKIAQTELATVSSAKIEYLELVHPDTLESIENIETIGLLGIAVWIGKTRLIDNIILRRRQPIIAIDGPAGAGKSTVTRLLAKALNLLYLDTGAMYRAVTWLIMHSGIDLEDLGAIAELINDVNIELIPESDTHQSGQVIINGYDVTLAIRTPEVTQNVSRVSAIKFVRHKLVNLQKEYGTKGGLVAEGRDIGTNVFPDAEIKIFLTASVEKRSQRRFQDFQHQGIDVNIEELAREIQARDDYDSKRAVSPLQKAPDATVINTDNLSILQVTEKIMDLYQKIYIKSAEKVSFGEVREQ